MYNGCTPDVCGGGFIDSACAIYHLFNQSPTKLINLGLANQTPVETILEAIDAYIGAVQAGRSSVRSTNAISFVGNGAPGTPLTPTLLLSAESGNTAIVNPDGLFVPLPPNLYQVKVQPGYAPYYLDDALIGGTDGVVALSFVASGGTLFGLPSIDLPTLVNSITTNSQLINNLTNSVLNEMITNQSFLTSITDAIEQQILNDNTFLTNLTQSIVNNPSSFNALCSAIANCTGSTACNAPSGVSAFVTVTGGGSSVTLNIDYTPASPTPSNGYIVRYRQAGSLGSYTTTGDLTGNPLQVTGLSPSDYEGFVKSDCGGGIFSSEVAFTTSNYINVNVTNSLPNSSITNTGGITGFTFNVASPVGPGQRQQGNQTGFTGVVSLSATSSSSASGHAFLQKNGGTLQIIAVSLSGGTTVIDFNSFTFVSTDQLEVGLEF